jgi:hypothetical protein
MRQLRLFPDESSELSDPDQAPVAYSPDPEHVRRRLHRILAEARAASVVPWEPERLRLYRTIFPQMTRWLPDEEAGQLRFAFDEEMARLKAA